MAAITARGQEHNLTINGSDYGFQELEFTPGVETATATSNLSLSPHTAVTETDASVTISLDGSHYDLMREFYNQYGTPQYCTVQIRGPEGGFRFGRVLVTGGPYTVPGNGIMSIEIDAHADYWQFAGGSYTAPQATQMGDASGSAQGAPARGIA